MQNSHRMMVALIAGLAFISFPYNLLPSACLANNPTFAKSKSTTSNPTASKSPASKAPTASPLVPEMPFGFSFITGGHMVMHSEISPDRRHLAYVQDRKVKILDLKTRRIVEAEIALDETFPTNLHWSRDGKQVAAVLQRDELDGTYSAVISFWDPQTGKVLTQLILDENPGYVSINWSPDGKRFVYSRPTAIVWLDAQNLKTKQTIQTNNSKTVQFDWSPDGGKFNYVDGPEIHVLDATTTKEIYQIAGDVEGSTLRWSPDSKYFLVKNGHIAAVCEAATGNYLGYKNYSERMPLILFPGENAPEVLNGPALKTDRLILPPRSGSSPFEGGNTGSPGWEKYDSPKSLQDCYALFDKQLISQNRERFKRTAKGDIYAFGGGSIITDVMMCDVYGKWDLRYLSNHFKRQGLTDPRNITSIILLSYWRHLNNLPEDLDTQIASHKMWHQHSVSFDKPDIAAPEPLLDSKFSTGIATDTSVRETKTKWKVLAFVQTEGEFSAKLLKQLAIFRLQHPKGVSVYIFVVPPNQLSDKRWPVQQPPCADASSSPAKMIKDIKERKDMFVADAPLPLTRALYDFIKPSIGEPPPLPQALVLDESNKISLRVNFLVQDNVARALSKAVK